MAVTAEIAAEDLAKRNEALGRGDLADAIRNVDKAFAEIELPVVTDEERLSELKALVEALSDGVVMFGKTAYTARRTPYVIFGNGVQKDEMAAPTFPTEDLGELAAMHLIAIKAYRQKFVGPVDLVWRCEPRVEIVEGGKVLLYSRLCFEPSLVCVADGVWVETRLTNSGLFN